MGVKKLYCIIIHIFPQLISGFFLIGIQRAYTYIFCNKSCRNKKNKTFNKTSLITNLSANMIHTKVISHFGQLNGIPMLRVLTLDNALYINPQFYMNSAKASKPEANTEVPT